jgi:hypothetical protein
MQQIDNKIINKAWIMYNSFEELESSTNINKGDIYNKFYGSLNIHVNQSEITDKPILIKIVVDESESMSECATTRTTRTKIEIVKITLINMMKYLSGISKNIWIELSGFNISVRNYIYALKITPESLDEIIEKINTLIHNSMTNLELAIDTIQTKAKNMIDNPEEFRTFGILLTDGEATTGITNPDELMKKIQPGMSISFIALGENHDADTMNKLGNATTTTTNWFISNIEHTGNIYGEILYNELHTLLTNTTLHIINGKIFDYKTNTYVNKLNIGNLSAETKKNYHIICDNPDECIVNISGIDVETQIEFTYKATEMPPLQNVNEEYLLEYNDQCFVEIQYIRLLVQEMLSKVRILNTSTLKKTIPKLSIPKLSIPKLSIPKLSIPKLSRSITQSHHNNNMSFQFPVSPIFPDSSDIIEINFQIIKLQNSIREIMHKKNLENNKILLGLLDDLNVVYHTNGTDRLMKYGFAREISQASQTSNTVDEIPELNMNNTNQDSISAYTSPGRKDIMRLISTGIKTNDTIIDNIMNTNYDINSLELTLPVPFPTIFKLTRNITNPMSND